LSTLGLIILFTGLSGLLSAFAAGFFLVLGDKPRAAVLPHLISFATGTLLAAALIGLLPHAFEGAGPGHAHHVGMALLLGILMVTMWQPGASLSLPLPPADATAGLGAASLTLKDLDRKSVV
jgi:zinc and cadmium transporter